jgi:hypothetical protein
MRLRTLTAAAALLVAGLAVTACGTDADVAEPAAEASPSASSAATAQGGHGASGAPAPDASQLRNGEDPGTPVSSCTTKTTVVRFVASAAHATESEPAAATVEVTNTSDATCVIVGATALTAKDDQGKAAPVETDNSAAGPDSVDLRPHASVTADVLYTDLNFEGTPSAREVCPVQASRVEIALPDDVARTVKVTKGDGTPGVFNVCGRDVKFGAFHS